MRKLSIYFAYKYNIQKMKFSMKAFFSKCDQILNGKLHFLCRKPQISLTFTGVQKQNIGVQQVNYVKVKDLFVMRGAIWYHLHNLKSVKNTRGGVLFFVSLQAKACNFTKSNTLPWVFFTFFKLYERYQIAQRTTYSTTIATGAIITCNHVPSNL